MQVVSWLRNINAKYPQVKELSSYRLVTLTSDLIGRLGNHLLQRGHHLHVLSGDTAQPMLLGQELELQTTWQTAGDRLGCLFVPLLHSRPHL